MTNKEKEWWLSVEDRFNRTYKFRGMPGYELRHVQMCEDMLSFFREEIENRLHVKEAIEIVPSPRLDYCGACKKEHGYDCPLDVDKSVTENVGGIM